MFWCFGDNFFDSYCSGDKRERRGNIVSSNTAHYLSGTIKPFHGNHPFIIDFDCSISYCIDREGTFSYHHSIELSNGILFQHHVTCTRIVKHVQWSCLPFSSTEHEQWVTFWDGVDDDISSGSFLQFL